MRNILKNRLALSTVVTTLIILVVSVLLAGVVTYFAINVTSTRVQEESLQLSYQHVWVTAAGAAQAAVMITNTGGRDVVISQIQVRGQTCANLFDLTPATTELTTDLTHVAALANASAVTGFAEVLVSVAAGQNIVLPASHTVVVYINTPDSISINDIGLTVGFTVFTSQAMYYKEANVQAA